MAKVHSHYENLKVARDAPASVIRAAYRALSQTYHPDRNSSPEASQIMVVVNQAYEVLSDPDKRKEHDAWILQAEYEDPASAEALKDSHASRRETNSAVLEERPASFNIAPWLLATGVALVVGLTIAGASKKEEAPYMPANERLSAVAAAASRPSIEVVQMTIEKTKAETLLAERSKESVYPAEMEKVEQLELGAAVLLLMPLIEGGRPSWDHMANGPIAWIDESYREEFGSDKSTSYVRDGLMRINVLGVRSTVLKKRKIELSWTVKFESSSLPKFGVERILLRPGMSSDVCFGTIFSNCDFDPIPSIRQAGITVSEICANDQTLGSARGIQLAHPSRKTIFARVLQNWGSGGASTDLILVFEPTANLCAL